MKWFAQSSFVLAFALAACSQADGDVAATSPAPAAPPSAAASPEPAAAGFIGDWAADAGWCADPTGAERPIRISQDRFEGYENACDIVSLDGGAGDWTAALVCLAEGQQSAERVRMRVDGDRMELSYLDRGGEPVRLTRCAG